MSIFIIKVCEIYLLYTLKIDIHSWPVKCDSNIQKQLQRGVQFTHAEIIWAVDVVLSNYSFKSSSNKSDIFSRMFPDSSIAKNFACGKAKCTILQAYS